MDIKAIIENDDTSKGRRFGLFIQALIIASIISFSIETIPDLDAGTKRILDAVEIIIVVIFTVEYTLRVYVADSKTGYIFSFYGLIDLAAILPFYIASGVDLRSIRVLRLLRLFRLFKLLRYNKAIQRFKRAFVLAKEEIILFSVATVILLYLSSVGIYYFEHVAQPEAFKSVFHCLWWAVSTLTTVGYGDVYPVTLGGRIFTFFMLMLGLGVVAVPAGLLATALSRTRLEDAEKEKGGPV